MERLTYSITEVAEVLGIGESLAYSLAKSGDLPGVIKLGERRMVVSKVALQKWLEKED